jgi:TFIIH basal transcription factor complex TTD-A subunit
MRVAGVLIECEPAIKSIIVHLDSENHDIIIEDLDETHLFVKENMVQLLKQKLEEVSLVAGCLRPLADIIKALEGDIQAGGASSRQRQRVLETNL